MALSTDQSNITKSFGANLRRLRNQAGLTQAKLAELAANVELGNEGLVIDRTLQDLADHFEIPEVPDVATTDPTRYDAFVTQLHQLEELTR